MLLSVDRSDLVQICAGFTLVQEARGDQYSEATAKAIRAEWIRIQLQNGGKLASLPTSFTTLSISTFGSSLGWWTRWGRSWVREPGRRACPPVGSSRLRLQWPVTWWPRGIGVVSEGCHVASQETEIQAVKLSRYRTGLAERFTKRLRYGLRFSPHAISPCGFCRQVGGMA